MFTNNVKPNDSRFRDAKWLHNDVPELGIGTVSNGGDYSKRIRLCDKTTAFQEDYFASFVQAVAGSRTPVVEQTLETFLKF